MTTLEKDPFRIFFPVGALLAFAGVTPWTYQYFGHPSYPRDLHRLLMINGFLLSFVAGFLMTAIPRFTSTFNATRTEIATTALAIIGSAMAAFREWNGTNFLLSAMAIACVAVFAVRRFCNKKANPPYTFIFIGVGLFLWLFADVVQFLSAVGLGIPAGWQLVSQDLFSNGAIMSLIVGVGGRLIPGILGWQEIVSEQRAKYEMPESFVKVVPVEIWISVAIFALSFFLEAFIPIQVCYLARAFVMVFFGVKYWSILKPPKTKSFLTWSIWPCCWCLVLGYFLPAFWSGATAHALHLILFGGVSLLTLLISTRVIFAHGGAGVEAEKSTQSISIFTALILLAMVTRVTAILWPTIYLNHISYAAALWTLALLVWAWIVGPRLLSRKS